MDKIELVSNETQQIKIITTTEKVIGLDELIRQLKDAEKRLSDWEKRSNRIAGDMQTEIDKLQSQISESKTALGIKEEIPPMPASVFNN